MVLAHQFASGPHLSGQNPTRSARTRSFWPKPDSQPGLDLSGQKPNTVSPEQIFLAKTQHSQPGPDLSAQNPTQSARTGSFWPKPDTVSPDRIFLAKTQHSQPELNWVQAGFAQYNVGCLWKKATESESGKLVVGTLRPDNSCTQACFQTRDTSGQNLTRPPNWTKSDPAYRYNLAQI